MISRLGRLLGPVLIAALVVLVLECLLGSAGIVLFPHIDTPDCAAPDPFCTPDGRPGWTPRAVLLVAGNAAALLVTVALLLLHRTVAAGARRD